MIFTFISILHITINALQEKTYGNIPNSISYGNNKKLCTYLELKLIDLTDKQPDINEI